MKKYVILITALLTIFITSICYGASFSGTGTLAGLAVDATPDQFTFTDQTNVAVSTTITSAAITVAGINHASAISVSGGTYDINASGSFTASAGTVSVGDTVRARHTSSGSNSTAVNTVVTIGSASDTFTSTTVAGVTLLAGNNTITANTEWETGSGGDLHVSLYTAVSSGKLTKGHFRIKDGAQTNAKMCVYSASGVVIECSASLSTAGFTVLTDAEFTFAGTYDIVSSTQYYLGIISDNYGSVIGTDTTPYAGQYISSQSYSSPATFNPASLLDSITIGYYRAWITN